MKKSMDMINWLTAALVFLLAGVGNAAEVRNVTAEQKWWPWNGKVEIQYEVVGEVPTNAWLQVAAVDCVSKNCYRAETNALSGDTGGEEGVHHVVWDMEQQGLSIMADQMEFGVFYSDRTFYDIGVYCIIDISGGANAEAYPVTYVTNLSGRISFITNTTEYDSLHLVLRRINPGTFMMNGQYLVTLTKPFYIGIFEVTVSQYTRVCGVHSIYHGEPQLNRAWNDGVRGGSWPSPATVDENSFMGRLRARTGLEFDLPTEAQWEYACRAGTTNKFNNGGDTEADLQQLGRYAGNGNGVVPVGSYRPNEWGLYDMHGNAMEWCLDWDGNLSSGVTNPVGASSGSKRVLRGGYYKSDMNDCTSSSRFSGNPSNDRYGYAPYYAGFRAVINLSE